MTNHLLSMHDLSRDEINHFLKAAQALQEKPKPQALKGKIIALCFFEPSTRTRLSFETAALRLGGKTIGFSDTHALSTAKGESLQDTIRVISSYADVIVIRHPSEGAARLAAEVSSVPVINAGDGANQHPTQTLLDLFTMKAAFGKLEGLHVAIMGDLKHGRTVHSLVEAAAHFDMRLYFVAGAPSCTLPPYLLDYLKLQGICFSFHREVKEILPKLDVLYLTRLQKERFHQDATLPYQALSLEDLKGAKASLKILHPLPRQEELPLAMDATPYAHYFEQAKNGVVVRQAILLSVFQKPKTDA